MLKKFGSWIVDVGEIREVVPNVQPSPEYLDIAAWVFFKGEPDYREIDIDSYEALLAWIEEQNTPHSYLVSQDGRMTWEWVKHNG